MPIKRQICQPSKKQYATYNKIKKTLNTET